MGHTTASHAGCFNDYSMNLNVEWKVVRHIYYVRDACSQVRSPHGNKKTKRIITLHARKPPSTIRLNTRCFYRQPLTGTLSQTRRTKLSMLRSALGSLNIK